MRVNITLKYTIPKRVYTAQVGIEEIKNNLYVYSTQEGIEEIKNNYNKYKPQVYTNKRV